MTARLPVEGKEGTNLDDDLHCIAAAQHAVETSDFEPTAAERLRIERGLQLMRERITGVRDLV